MKNLSEGHVVIGLLLLLRSGSTAPLGHQFRISKHPVILVVSFDGFRYDYFKKVSTPTLDALKAAGVHTPYLEPVFPTKTFPSHQSIATGLYTESHGIVDNSVFDPKSNRTLSGSDPAFWNYHDDVHPIWLLNEMAGDERVSGTLMWPGSNYPYGRNNDTLPTYFYPGYNVSVPWEERVDMVISWITNDAKPANLVFLYFDEPDTSGHAFGPSSPVTVGQVAKADNRTSFLIERLKEVGIFDKINLIILSDHGMAGVSQERIIHLNGVIDRSLISAQYGSTPLLQFKATEGKKHELYENLKTFCGTRNCTAWEKGDLRKRKYHYAASRRIQDVILISDPGYAFDDFEDLIKSYDSQWNMTANSTREYGVHGYVNSDASMRAIFLAHGPSFRKGIEIASFKTIDIVPLLCAILNLKEPPNNGSFARVAGAVKPQYLLNLSTSFNLTVG